MSPIRCGCALLLVLVLGCSSQASLPAADAALADAALADVAASTDVALADLDAATDLATADTATAPADVTATDLAVFDAEPADLAPAQDVETGEIPDTQLDVPADVGVDAALVDGTDIAGSDAESCPQDAGAYPVDVVGELPAGLCFVGASPAADAFVLDVPAPSDCTCAPDPPTFFGSDPIAAPTLSPELGYGDAATGAFVPYADGDWAPITHGPQGGIHVWAAFRAAIAGATEPKIKVMTRATSTIGCALAGVNLTTAVLATPDAAVLGTYTNASAVAPGLQVAFPVWGGQSAAYCGQWLELHMQIRDPVSGAWGEVKRTVRLYDTSMSLGGG